MPTLLVYNILHHVLGEAAFLNTFQSQVSESVHQSKKPQSKVRLFRLCTSTESQAVFQQHTVMKGKAPVS